MPSKTLVFPLIPIAFIAIVSLWSSLPVQAQTPVTWNGSGASGVDPYGQEWFYNTNLGVYGWGVPGVFRGNIPWAGPDTLSAFTVTFTNLPVGISIRALPIDNDRPEGFDPQLKNVTTVKYWTATLTGVNSITFTAPIGAQVNRGNLFFANVTFTGNPASSPFVVNYNNPLVVPEANSAALLGLALPMIGAVAVVRRRKK